MIGCRTRPTDGGRRSTDGGWPMTTRSYSAAGALRGVECTGVYLSFGLKDSPVTPPPTPRTPALCTEGDHPHSFGPTSRSTSKHLEAPRSTSKHLEAPRSTSKHLEAPRSTSTWLRGASRCFEEQKYRWSVQVRRVRMGAGSLLRRSAKARDCPKRPTASESGVAPHTDHRPAPRP